MPRGPRPEPAAIKRAKGNPGRRPIAEPEKSEAAVVVGKLQPPAWLNTAANVKNARARRLTALTLEIWNRTAPLVDRLRLIQGTDLEALGRWCRYMAEWIEYTRDLDRNGATYETSSPHVEKMVRLNPAAHLRRAAELALKELEDRLGFSPSARLRLYQQLAAHQGSLPFDKPTETPADAPAPATSGRVPVMGFLAGNRLN